ncbi:MAG TPA: hypothetical protein HA222_02720 [Candidatus Diapherotrites archaeon]|uniref:Nucleotidyltransferase domain-containing protein n=1 Tax=Candidatus Iainarchaeum sp. TaxID=3101447 RepID=A0A7J4JXZ3_9ARCH|nr:hypothetical protein [Candidatus Diapherotrites archaeon]
MVSYNERCFFVFLKELQKAALWKVLEYFALGNEPIHIKGLARKLGISPASAFKDLKILEKSGFLEAQKAGNSLIYSSKDLPLFLEFKRLVFLLYAMPFFEKFLKQNHEVLGLAVFGSIASGSFDKNSDIDLLVLSPEKALRFQALEELGLRIGMEAKPIVFSIGEWRKLAKDKKPFVESILQNKIAVSGEF